MKNIKWLLRRERIIPITGETVAEYFYGFAGPQTWGENMSKALVMNEEECNIIDPEKECCRMSVEETT